MPYIIPFVVWPTSPKQMASHRAAYEKSERGDLYHTRRHGAEGAQSSAPADAPFELPDGWAWCKLEDLCRTISDGDHQAPPQEQSGIPFLVISNVSNGILDFFGTRFVGQAYFKSLMPSRIPSNGDILVTVTGSYGIIVRVDTNRPFCFQRHMALLKCCAIPSEYLFYVLQCNDVKRYFDSVATGTAQKTVALNRLRATPIPLPPLAEQKRIVARIEELFKIADSLGKAAAGLAETAKRLDRKILDLAIRGKLVPQDPTDEPASELLKRIAAASHKSPCQKRKEGNSRSCASKDTPFAMPQEWAWAQLGDVCKIEMGQSPDGASINKETGIEFHQGKICFTERLLARSNEKTSRPTKIAHGNSVLLCVRAPVGKVNTVNRKICIGRGLCAISPMCGMNVEFWFFWLKCLEETFNKKATGSTFKAITKNTVVNQIIPLPPLEEQKRIVAKIEELRKVTQMLTM